MKHKIFISIIVFSLIFSLFGCQQNSIKKPDVETKAITQNSLNDLVTFDLEIPKDCEVFIDDKNSIVCEISSEKHNVLPFEMSPYQLFITDYLMPDFMPVNDKYKQSYEDLFKGKYDGINEIICDNIEYINMGKVIEKFPDVQFDTPESFMDYLNLLVDGISTPDMELPDKWEEIEWATDFTYSKYNGKNANIIAIEYSFTFIDKTYKAINCYRDDNYSVCGVFDDELEISSGDIALWIADNMEVTEHYKIEDNELKQEGIDY